MADIPKKRQPIDQELVKAIAHPLRVEILEVLSAEDASGAVLGRKLGCTTSHANYHLGVLNECECITLVRTRSVRGTKEYFYRANPRSFIGDLEWRSVPDFMRTNVSAGTLQTFVAQAVASLRDGAMDRDAETTLTWFPISVDGKGKRQIADLMRDVVAQVHRIHSESTGRAEGQDLTRLIIGFSAFPSAPHVE